MNINNINALVYFFWFTGVEVKEIHTATTMDGKLSKPVNQRVKNNSKNIDKYMIINILYYYFTTFFGLLFGLLLVDSVYF